MALSNTTVKQTYQGDGATVAFAIPFALIVSGNHSTETKVYVRDESDANDITQTLQVEGAGQDYTLTGGTPPTTVTFNSAPAATDKIIIIRVLPNTQTLDLEESGDFPAESFETALDRMAAQIQELKEKIERMPILRITEQFGDTTLDQPFATYLIGVNEDNDGFQFWSPSEVQSAAEGGFTGQGSTVTIANSQATPDNITGLLLDSDTYSGAFIVCEIERTGIFSHTLLFAQWTGSDWRLNESLSNGEAHGLTFSITSAGQAKYTSDGSGAGTLKFRMLRFTQ